MEPSLYVLKLHERMNDDGLLYMTVPHLNVPTSYKHFQHFNLKKIKSYFEEHFRFEKVQYIQKTSVFLKIINRLMNNGLYIITNSYLNNLYYSFYKKYFFFANEQNCERIYIKMRKK